MKHRMFKAITSIMIVISMVFPALVRAQVSFKTGDIMDARNVTSGQSAWSKAIEAKTLDEIEFRVMVENVGNTESSDVNIRAGFALDPGNNLKNRIYVGVWSAPQAVGSVEVKVDDETAQKLTYVPGKSIKYGGGCDGCAVSDNIAKTLGAYVGKVKPGEKIEVRFRAQVTNRQDVVPTATPKPTSKPVSNSTSSAVAKTNPKTGISDPLWIRTMMLLGLGLAGLGIRQLAFKMGRIEA